MDEAWMSLALKEAAKGLGRCSPNPAVGAVIVKKGKLIARGYHHQAGGPHAEINALKKAGTKAKGATLYVTLEPCKHHGKTGPCTDAIKESGIRRVVIGAKDPHAKASGAARILRRAKIQVSTGILAEDCAAFYRYYHVFLRKKRPLVCLKAAMSLDGMVATAKGESQWITGLEARHHVHQQRDRVDAILVGWRTIQSDNPRLTTRLGKKRGHDPVRVIVDARLDVPNRSKIFHQSSAAPTWIAVNEKVSSQRQKFFEERGASILRCKSNTAGRLDLKDLLQQLAKRGIMSIVVEGGPHIHASFLQSKLVDQVSFYIAPKIIGKGRPFLSGLTIDTLSKAFSVKEMSCKPIGPDLWVTAAL
jgi:diaminohydroxyphosphoribosylaminopyrimidine deaminase / 5-amino-6-(5-phosphoribosylamino)uracil reductase